MLVLYVGKDIGLAWESLFSGKVMRHPRYSIQQKKPTIQRIVYCLYPSNIYSPYNSNMKLPPYNDAAVVVVYSLLQCRKHDSRKTFQKKKQKKRPATSYRGKDMAPLVSSTPQLFVHFHPHGDPRRMDISIPFLLYIMSRQCAPCSFWWIWRCQYECYVPIYPMLDM